MTTSNKYLYTNHTAYMVHHTGFSVAIETTLIVILCVTMCLAVYGNIGMLLVLYKNDKMWNSTNILIGNLAFSGVMVSAVSIPFHLSSLLHSTWPYRESTTCKFNAFTNSELLLGTIFTHTMISVDKYIGIVKPFSRVMTIRRTLFILFLIWFLAAIMSVGPLAHLSRYAYNPSTLICGVGFPEKRKDSIYLLILAGVGFIIPNLVMGHAYIQIFIAVRNHTKRLKKNSTGMSLDVLSLQKRLILTVFFSLIGFLVCWTPFCILVLMAIFVDRAEEIPRGLGVSAYVSGYLYNVVNPLIICSMSPRFGEGIITVTLTAVRAPLKCVKHYINFYCCKRAGYYKGKEEQWSESLTPTPTIVHAISNNLTFLPALTTPTLLSYVSAAKFSYSSSQNEKINLATSITENAKIQQDE